MALQLVTAPAVYPLTETEIWDHLRLNLTQFGEPADKDHVTALLAAATAYLDGRDGILGRALVTQVWDLTLDQFPATDSIALPLPPIQSVTSITYVDELGASQTFSSSKYALSAAKHWGPRINLNYGEVWPTTRYQPDAVTVRFVAGYDDGSSPADPQGSVPAPIKAAMKLLIAHWYEHREQVVMGQTPAELPMAVTALLGPYRVLR